MSGKDKGKAPVAESSSSALEVSLHPLALINISDHYTRERVMKPGASKPPRVIGALFGTQKGRRVEISNTFELKYNVIEGVVVLEKDYLVKKMDQYRQVFPSYEFIGWYSTSASVQSADLVTHKTLLELNESPLLLLMDPEMSPAHKELPVTIYEAEFHVIDGEATFSFTPTPYKVETINSERIAVDHINKIGTGATSTSALSEHLTSVHSSVTMLSQRVALIRSYIKAVAKGDIKPDHTLMRRISALTSRLPAMEDANFNAGFISEQADSMLMAYLATLTTSTNNLNELIDKFAVTHDKHNRRRGVF